MSLGGEGQPWDTGAQTARLRGGEGSSTQSNGEKPWFPFFWGPTCPRSHKAPASCGPAFLSYLSPGICACILPRTPPPQSTLTHTGLQQPQPSRQKGILQASQAGGSRRTAGAPSSRATLTALALVGDFITQTVQGPNN